MLRFLWSLLVVLGLGASLAQAQAPKLAFPTAEGAGRFAQGGRGGKAYHINSLANTMGNGGSCNAGGCGGSAPFTAGTITLRDCLHDRFDVGPRTCIFRIGGTITYPCNHGRGVLQEDLGPQSCQVSKPYLTIAGQTAPGQGIMIKNMNLEFMNSHDVIVRHLRVRAGKDIPQPQGLPCPPQCPDGNSMAVFGASVMVTNVIFDHVSTGWSPDDGIVVAGAKDVTMQWMLISEGLGQDGSDPGKAYSSGYCTSEPIMKVSILHSLITTHHYRTPNIGGCDTQFINNVVSNVYQGPQIGPVYDAVDSEWINNYFKVGPDAQEAGWSPYIQLIGCGQPGMSCTHAANSRSMVMGNLHSVQRPTLGSAGEFVVLRNKPGNSPLMSMQTTPLGTFDPIPSITTAAIAYNEVLGQVPGKLGAGARIPYFDTIDQRAVSDTLNGTGTNEPAAGLSPGEGRWGGYPIYTSSTPYPDTDGDGMSDAWEDAHGLDKNNPADGPTITASGYSNLELFLNALAGDTPVLTETPTVGTFAKPPRRFRRPKRPGHRSVRGARSQLSGQAASRARCEVAIRFNMFHRPAL